MARWGNEGGLPIGPLQLWIWGRRRALALAGAAEPSWLVAQWLGVHEDSINRWLERRSPVSEGFVDEVLTRSGHRAVFEEVYPPAFLDAPSRARQVLAWVGMVLEALEEAEPVVVRGCGWGAGCAERAVPGGRFCGPHGAVLAGIREGLRLEGRDMSAEGGRSLVEARSRGDRRRPTTPICCAEGCFEPRPRGQRFCVSCRDAGLVEEEVFAA